ELGAVNTVSITGTALIHVNGGDGASASDVVGFNDGAGGGSGGMIFVHSASTGNVSVSSGASLSAEGGDGGDTNSFAAAAGGGGAGGRISLRYTGGTLLGTVSVAPGVAGVSTGPSAIAANAGNMGSYT